MNKLFLLMLENVVTIAFAIVTTVYISKTYGAEHAGNFGVVLSLCSFFSCLFNLGMDNAIHKFLAKNIPARKLFSCVLRIKLIGLLVYILISFPILLTLLDKEFGYIILIYFAATVSLFFGNSSFLRIFMVHFRKAEIITVSAAISRVIGIIFVLFAVNNKMPFEIVSMYLVFFGLVSNIIYYYYFRKLTKCEVNFTDARFREIKYSEIYSDSRNVFIASIFFNSFIYLDSVLLYYISDFNSANVGIYVIAQKVIFTFSFVGVVVSNFLSRKFYIAVDSKQSFPLDCFVVMIRCQLTIALIMIAIVSILAGIFESFMGVEFHGLALVLMITSFSWLFIFPSTSFSKSLIIIKRTDIEIKKSVFVAIFNIGLNILLIKYIGVIGVALVMVCSYAAADLIAYFIFKDTRFLAKVYLYNFSTILDVKKTVYLLKKVV